MVQTEQFAVLAALVFAANLVLLGVLGLPRLSGTRRGPSAANPADQADPANPANAYAANPAYEADAASPETEFPGARLGSPPPTGRVPPPESDADRLGILSSAYERVMRVVAGLFIGAVLVVVTVSGDGNQAAVYVLLALAIFLVVLAQDELPLARLGRLRFAIEALVGTVLISLLVLLTGGYQSPFFFGYLLIAAGGSLWAAGIGPLLMTLIVSGAYVLAVGLAPVPVPADPGVFAQISFNLVSLALISYVGSVLGREQREAREAALRLSRFDSLTGLHSRDYIITAIEQETMRASRSDRPFGLLMVDLDGLKPVNDRFGHEAGDRLLRGLGEVIRANIRATDIGARYGGDEFIIMLPDTDLAGTLRVGEKVRGDIGRFALPHDGGVARTSASVGLVTYPDDGRTAAELMRRADLAMYEAKRRGRDQIVRYARQPDERVAVPVGEVWEGPGD